MKLLKWLGNIVEGWWKTLRNLYMKFYLLYSFYCNNPLIKHEKYPEQILKSQGYLWFSLKASLCNTVLQ